MAICYYFINGYWWLFYWWLLMIILLMVINDYCVSEHGVTEHWSYTDSDPDLSTLSSLAAHYFSLLQQAWRVEDYDLDAT
jgi:hypothetical protein